MIKHLSVILFFSLFMAGCGNGSTSDKPLAGDSNTLNEPLIEGTWYKPNLDTNWQWQLQGDINTNYDVLLYDIDLFDANIDLIQLLKDEGKKVICYFSAGSYEAWREDASSFPSETLGNELDGWAGEKWLDIRHIALQDIMIARLDLAKTKGCDGVEPDNVDGYSNNTGFVLNENNQLFYNKFLANEAHKRGLSIGLKNDLDQIRVLEPFFDFSVNEQCHQYNECSLLQPFIENNKPVFNAEYAQKYIDNTNNARDSLCMDANAMEFKTLILPIVLDDSLRFSCD